MLMKKIISFILGILVCISLTSCITEAYAQNEEISTEVSVVITNGIPCYDVNGLLIYYRYNDLFYYPYYYNNRWYFRHYARPLPPRHYRPMPRDFYRHRPNVTHHHRPNVTHHHKPQGKPNSGFGMHGHKPNGGTMHRPQGGTNHSGRRHFGGRR